MKILHAITGMQKAAGTSVFCGELANELVAKGHSVDIAVLNPKAEDVYPVDKRVNFIGLDSLEGRSYDVVHIHALWSPALHRVGKWARRNKIPVVWSPHGMLQKWALKNKWWKKFAALALYQWRDLDKADLLHATAQTEVEDIRRLHLGNRVVVAPLGVRIGGERNHETHEIHEKGERERILLFVSRVQRKKGLPVLLDAWSMLPEEVRNGWHVRIVGPDQDNHTAELKAQCERLGIADDFTFVGPKFGDDLDKEYKAADLFVLPTHSENFGSVVIEALARGVPVICSQGAPWEELETYGCGWWPEDSTGALLDALKKALSRHLDELILMGDRGMKLVQERYTWDAISDALQRAYRELI